MDKEDKVHIYNEILHPKKEIISFVATWRDLEVIMLSEVNHKEKYKYHMMWNLKYDINEPTYEAETDRENRYVVTKVEGWIGSLRLADTNHHTYSR